MLPYGLMKILPSTYEGSAVLAAVLSLIKCDVRAPPPRPPPTPQVAAADGGSRKVFVIDEIGKMELFSQSFIRAVRQTLDGSSFTILGTVPVPKGKPLGLVEEVRNRRDVKVFTVSPK